MYWLGDCFLVRIAAQLAMASDGVYSVSLDEAIAAMRMTANGAWLNEYTLPLWLNDQLPFQPKTWATSTRKQVLADWPVLSASRSRLPLGTLSPHPGLIKLSQLIVLLLAKACLPHLPLEHATIEIHQCIFQILDSSRHGFFPAVDSTFYHVDWLGDLPDILSKAFSLNSK